MPQFSSAQPASSQKSYTTSPVSPTSPYTSADYSYFSPQAPFTSPSPSTSSGTLSVPNSPYVNVGSGHGYKPPSQGSGTTTTTTTTSPGGPVITATMTTRNSSGVNNVSSAGGGGGYSGYPSYQPHANSNHDVLQQFSLHIPPPPPLSLSLSAQRNPSASSMDSRSFSGSPQMSLSSTPVQHTLSVQLPRNVQPEMVTISANKGDRIRVVADAWGGGNECHYEWQISFPPHDIDMGAVHARFDPDGRLTLEVRRRAAARARYL
ncbi:hypothetical protein CVT25_003685 [Psilocybe cyanescens]|uniref:SHSP domain-containing protein n=1 Tax=Psilocybe cyanescens TaxID=93625 RepID=A0A409WP52_PSICY|nr:hypothetical protein CVT25_003685 [Psilocybe cyanescens]